MQRAILPALCAILGFAGAAAAASPKELGKFGNWNAASYGEGEATRCFIASRPTSISPPQLSHGDVVFFVQTREDKDVHTESSLQTGYSFAKDSLVTVKIGDDTFQMFTQGQSAWLRRLEREGEFLAAMKAGSSMTVDATSARGNETSYVFSLAGVTAAARLLEQCDD